MLWYKGSAYQREPSHCTGWFMWRGAAPMDHVTKPSLSSITAWPLPRTTLSVLAVLGWSLCLFAPYKSALLLLCPAGWRPHFTIIFHCVFTMYNWEGKVSIVRAEHNCLGYSYNPLILLLNNVCHLIAGHNCLRRERRALPIDLYNCIYLMTEVSHRIRWFIQSYSIMRWYWYICWYSLQRVVVGWGGAVPRSGLTCVWRNEWVYLNRDALPFLRY